VSEAIEPPITVKASIGTESNPGHNLVADTT
jgi:hypothetical protein